MITNIIALILASNSINTHMSNQDMQNTGVDKLTPNEQKALQQWIDTHHHLKDNNSASISDPSQAQEMRPTVSQTIRQGSYIELSDDSLWQIDPEDRPITQSWISPAEIQIKDGAGNQEYPYLLINMVTGSKVRAKKIQSIPSSPMPNQNQ